MKAAATRWLSAVRRRLIDDPRGLGRPVATDVFDRDYAAGRWNLLFADAETPRNRTVADLIAGGGYACDPAATVRRFPDCLNPPGSLVVSYYRSGNHTAIWRRIAGVAETVREVVARNDRGAIWDIKLLRPRTAPTVFL